MSQSFFEALDIPQADIDLGIGSGSHAQQVGNTMIAFERVVKFWQPDWVVVVGDVNATCACSITAKKEHVNVAHIEAGLRSFDMDMPEEINRMVTDRLSDILFTPDEIASEQLLKEGVAAEQICFVGNIMIDTLMRHKMQAEALNVADIIEKHLIDEQPAFGLFDQFHMLTMHRPSNVDQQATLQSLVELFIDLFDIRTPLVWSLHPRTRKNLEKFGLWDRVLKAENIVLTQPLGYHEMLKMNMSAKVMLTDSGGLQEECCVLGTHCITMRENTERPITQTQYGGVSVLTGNSPARIREAYREAMNISSDTWQPPYWDGRTAKRIVDRFLLIQQGNV